MTQTDDIQRFLAAKAQALAKQADGFEQDAAVQLLLNQLGFEETLSDPDAGPPEDVKFGLGFHHDWTGSFSVKPGNYFISWKRLLLPGASIPASYASSTLSAMTLLTFLVRGAVYKFDQIDAKILAIMHARKSHLPCATAAFYDAVPEAWPPEINKALYMQRVVQLAIVGAISIKDDQLQITERFLFTARNRPS